VRAMASKKSGLLGILVLLAVAAAIAKFLQSDNA
jgi:hypothetical protein